MIQNLYEKMHGKPRKLHTNELTLLRFMLDEQHTGLENLENLDVRDLSDGGMGSIEFYSEHATRRVEHAVTTEFVDSDDVTISITVNIDQFGDLYEFDIWKVDFSPVQRYPAPEHVRTNKR